LFYFHFLALPHGSFYSEEFNTDTNYSKYIVYLLFKMSLLLLCEPGNSHHIFLCQTCIIL